MMSSLNFISDALGFNKQPPRLSIFFRCFSPNELSLLFSIDGEHHVLWYAREFNITYAHTARCLHYLEDLGLVHVNTKEGRKRIPILTPEAKKAIDMGGVYLRKILEMAKPNILKMIK